MEVELFMFNNVQGECKSVISLKWFATESCIQLIWYALRWQIRTVCHAKNDENHALFVLWKMSKITLLLWKDFGKNFTLVEGLWSIPCLPFPPPNNQAHLQLILLFIHKIPLLDQESSTFWGLTKAGFWKQSDNSFYIDNKIKFFKVDQKNTTGSSKQSR